MQLVSIQDIAPEIIFDLRYLSNRNVVGAPISDVTVAQLQAPAAAALAQAQASLTQNGLRLVVWDAYRTAATQAALLGFMKDERYVLEESNHCKGLAVDVTLAGDNQLLDMGTDHDDFSTRAHANANGLTKEQIANRRQLTEAMTAAGFKQWPYEWWHFDFAE